MRILIVEDDKDVCEILTDYLTNIFEKIEISCCNDGSSALYNINLNHYDYFFFDLSISTAINGMDLIKAARIKILLNNGGLDSSENDPGIFVISGNIDKPTRKYLRDHNIDGALHKPFSYKNIIEMIKNLSCRLWYN